MGEIDISTTGGWYAWEDFKLPNLVIEEARQAVLRLEFVGGDFNLNYVEFIESDGLGDSDGDGAVDLTEFAFGSDAGEQASLPVLPLGFDHQGNFCQTVPVVIGGVIESNCYFAAGMKYIFEGAQELGAWNEPTIFIENPVGVPPAPAGYRYLTFRLADESMGAGFLRVRVVELAGGALLDARETAN